MPQAKAPPAKCCWKRPCSRPPSESDAPAKAEYVLEKIEHAVHSLEQLPERGALTKELLALGIRDYREIYFKPYRIIYRLIDKQVDVYLIVDGRRDMQSVLSRRMLRP